MIFEVSNRPGVARAILQTPPPFINSFIKRSFSSNLQKKHKSQTIGSRDMKLLHNVHQLSNVMCHVSPVTGIFFYKWVEIVGVVSVFNGA